jgi:Alternative complex III, ActD subunit
MSETKTLLALFEDIDPAVAAIDQLRDMGISDGQINVISGIPLTESMLGRPRQWSNVPRLAAGGAVAGFLIGSFLAFVTPWLYPLLVGGQGLIPGPPTVVVLFEMTMLGMLVSTFIGVFLDSTFPSYRPKEYVSQISDGKIAILFNCPADNEMAFVNAMTELRAQSIAPAEAQKL